MDEQKVLEAIASGETAYGLLLDAMPGIEGKFDRLCNRIIGLLAEVKKHFPDATYYTGSGGFNILLGNSHGDSARAQRQFEAIGSSKVSISDGDY